MSMYRVRPVEPPERQAPPLPSCMYSLRAVNTFQDEPDLKITQQVVKFLKLQIPNKVMAELEKRQDHLLQQLDILYERIQGLSSLCKAPPRHTPGKQQLKKSQIPLPSEIVINASGDYLPYFLHLLVKGTLRNEGIRWTYHVHSSVPTANIVKIKEFMKLVEPSGSNGSSINVKLIFKDVAANTELKLSSIMAVPIIGEVNILRYLSYIFPDAVPYDESYEVDALLDLCYLIQRPSTEISTVEPTLKKMFAQSGGDWIYGKQLSIVDIAAYSIVKQMNRIPKTVPKAWLDKCSQLVKV